MGESALELRPRLRMPYAGADWLSENLRFTGRRPVSDIGERVAEVLGYAYHGIYHLPSSALFHERTRWDDDLRVWIVLPGQMANRDVDTLSRLMAACAALGVRVGIEGAANGYVRLRFCRMGVKYGGLTPYVDCFDLPTRPERADVPASDVNARPNATEVLRA